MKIGKIIKEERLKRELTQEEFAQEFFVTRQLVSKWENSKSYPDLDQVVQMSEWFDLSLDYLLKEDTKMVDELNFDGKLKKRMTYALWGIIGIIISIIFACFIVWWFIEPPILQAKDINITQVEKIYLPEKQIKNPETGETWTVPADVEYKIYFKTTKPFVNLFQRTGMVNMEDEDGIQIMLANGDRKLFGGKKESMIYLYSRREDFYHPSVNQGKDVYLMSQKKGNGEDIESWSDKIFDWDELAKLPVTKESSK